MTNDNTTKGAAMARITTTQVGGGRYRTVAEARGLRSRAYASTPGRAHTMARIRLARALRLSRDWPAVTHTAPDVRESPAAAEARAELSLLQRHAESLRATLASDPDGWRATMIQGALDALGYAIEAAGRSLAQMDREGR